HTRFSRDWSSDVCSSDLVLAYVVVPGAAAKGFGAALVMGEGTLADVLHRFSMARMLAKASLPRAAFTSRGASSSPSHSRSSWGKIGRASCRERVSVAGGA